MNVLLVALLVLLAVNAILQTGLLALLVSELRDLGAELGDRIAGRQVDRITADNAGESLSVYAGDTVTASSTSRTLGGVVVRFGVPGHTSRGKLRVRPGALEFAEDLGRIKLTREHDRNHSRGHLVAVDQNAERIRASLRVADGPEGDAAIREAQDRTRDGLSFDIVDAVIVGDEITAGRVVAIGQVGIPAYEDGRIDSIAASQQVGERSMLTEQQRARLNELRAMTTRNDAQERELQALTTLAGDQPATDDSSGEGTPAGSAAAAEPAPAGQSAAGQSTPAAAGQSGSDQGGQQVAASMPAVPSGVPSREGARTTPRGGEFARFVSEFTRGLQERAGGGSTATITAALQDITHTAHSGVIEPPAWSGELWSGLLYQPEWSDLFNTGSLTHWTGIGWRFTSKLEIQDYAGDKTEIPSDNVTTESSSYEAARMSVGVDIDRKFFDFPNEGFVQALFEQVRESWAIKLDAKIQAYTVANAVAARDNERAAPDPVGNPDIAAQDTLIKAVAVAVRALKRRRVGSASWVYVNDEDLFTLLELTQFDVPAFLRMFKVDPENFRSSPDVPEGTVLAGVKPAATVRTLPGSPIRVDAQNLSKAGIDEAFFGYWAIEEHHTSGIAKASFTPPA